MTNVLLLKAPSNDSPDRYEECFKRQGYTPHSIPVLETILDNLDSLQRIVSTGPGVHGYDGVIITSKRAGDAWRHAVAALESVRVATPPGS
jgi:uroporphyrinogen-III synthase